MNRTILTLGLSALAFTSAGCLIVSNKEVSKSGVEVSENTLAQIEPGKTTGDWLQTTLGPPTVQSKLSNGNEIWRYTYTETKSSGGAVFLIFAGSDEKSVEHAVMFELKDGIVQRSWRA